MKQPQAIEEGIKFPKNGSKALLASTQAQEIQIRDLMEMLASTRASLDSVQISIQAQKTQLAELRASQINLAAGIGLFKRVVFRGFQQGISFRRYLLSSRLKRRS
jgi:hypothetical protein